MYSVGTYFQMEMTALESFLLLLERSLRNSYVICLLSTLKYVVFFLFLAWFQGFLFDCRSFDLLTIVTDSIARPLNGTVAS